MVAAVCRPDQGMPNYQYAAINLNLHDLSGWTFTAAIFLVLTGNWVRRNNEDGKTCSGPGEMVSGMEMVRTD